MRRVFIVLFLVLAFVLIATAISAPAMGEQANNGTGQETAQVQQINVDIVVSTTGTIVADRSATLGFGVSGTVQEILVKEGDVVTAGQPLARLDSTNLGLQVQNAEQSLTIAQTNFNRLSEAPTAAQRAQAESALANAQVQLTNARTARLNAPDQQMMTCMSIDTARTSLNDAQTIYDRYVRDGLNADPTFTANTDHPAALARDNAQRAFNQAEAQCRVATNNANDNGQVAAAEAALAQAEAALAALTDDPTQTELTISGAQVRQAEIALEQAQRNFENATITAPFDGVVSAVNLRIGQTVSPGASVITLTDLDPLHIEADVDEVDVTKLSLGMEASMLMDALDNSTITGTVSRIAPIGRVVQGVTTYGIQIDLNGTVPEVIRAGMGGEVDIVVGTLKDSLVIPTRAIQRTEATEYVLIPQAEGNPLQVVVTSGQSIGELTVIVPVNADELGKGDTVIVGRERANIFQPGGFR
jgi:RND family efflux transporter MFP subunit